MIKQGKNTDKKSIARNVFVLARQSKSLDELELKLQQVGIESYRRKDVLTGVWFGKRKFRLTTLGVGKEQLKVLTLENKRLRDLENMKSRKRGRNRNR